ncbi:MAG: hypothetical protein KU29_01265 [Sulfurovum sp. FS06-10]|nr:MAG: hypothetical protein KU29_01265 [Sulfurovum sp. FS06-10]
MVKSNLFVQKKTLKAWLTLAIGLLISVGVSFYVKEHIRQNAVKHFSFIADQLSFKIEERLHEYALVLKSASSLFRASDTIDRDEWNVYVHSLRLDNYFPGNLGLAYNQIIPPEKLTEHIETIRAQGVPHYTLKPEGKRDVYTSIVYIEPLSPQNANALGYDTYSDPIRKAAMDRARDSGEPAITGKLELVQDAFGQKQAAIIMYAPIYAKHLSTKTVEERKRAIVGWTSGPYRMDSLIRSILVQWEGSHESAIKLCMFDGVGEHLESLLFSNHDTTQIASDFKQKRTITFNGHHWTLLFDNINPSLEMNTTLAWATLSVGVVLSLLIFAVLLAVINTQTNAERIAEKLTSDIKESKRLLKESEFRWKFAIEGSRDGVWDWNIQTNVSYYTTRWKEILGYGENDILPRHEEWEKRIHPEDREKVRIILAEYFEGKRTVYEAEFRMRCKDNQYKWILSRGIVVERSGEGNPLRMIGTHTDISERKMMEEEVHHLAFYDALTQLPNRRLLHERLKNAISTSKRNGLYHALIFLDLDNFKPLNDANGHTLGDLLLIEVAQRLKSSVREVDTVARFGGDEFVVIITDLSRDKIEAAEKAMGVATKIHHAFTQPYILPLGEEIFEGLEIEHHCTASIGVILFSDHEGSEDELIKWADNAMYQAKAKGRNQIVLELV